MTDLTPSDAAKLEMNARGYRYDPVLDAAADLLDAGDLEGWRKLPPQVRDLGSIQRDFREQHRRAVTAGVISEKEDHQP